MSILVPIARILTAGIFISGGVNTAKNPAHASGAAAPFLEKLRAVAPVPATDEQLVQANAVAQVVGGAALAAGKFPRLAPLTLIASLVPTTLAGHAFWEKTDPADKQAHQIHFFKNASMVGGLVFAVAAASKTKKIDKLTATD
ncbi:DoxX family protein [Dermacoccaceae bacterium W4C1]